jgi:hypothetical protein
VHLRACAGPPGFPFPMVFFIASSSAGPAVGIVAVPGNDADNKPQGLPAALNFSLTGREINERIDAYACLIIENQKMSLVCECGDGDCRALVRLTREQYHGACQNHGTFVVRKGHESPDTDRILSRHGQWLIVEKFPKWSGYSGQLLLVDRAMRQKSVS